MVSVGSVWHSILYYWLILNCKVNENSGVVAGLLSQPLVSRVHNALSLRVSVMCCGFAACVGGGSWCAVSGFTCGTFVVVAVVRCIMVVVFPLGDRRW